MKLFLIAIFLAAASYPAVAQETYKCKINGNLVFQDKPCPGVGKHSDAIPPKVAPAVTDNGSQPSDLDKQKAYLAGRAKEQRIYELNSQIGSTEGHINGLHESMQYELAAVDAKRASANNNLAGSTYLQSLATEKQAIASRYEIEIATARDRLKTLREDLKRVQEK